MDFFESISRKFQGEVLKLRLPDDVKVQPNETELEQLCERIQSEAGLERSERVAKERSRHIAVLSMPKMFGGKSQLVAIRKESLQYLSTGIGMGKTIKQ